MSLSFRRRRSKAEFISRYGPWAVVAGASEGIGEAFSRQLAAQGLDLLLIARRKAPLEALAADLESSFGIQAIALALDLGSEQIIDQLEPHLLGREVGLLVYNACHSEIGEFLDQPIASKLKTLEVNCRGPLLLASLFGERLARRGAGGLLLMSSMAGFQGTAMVGTYGASKAFNTVLGEALWSELGRRGVDVLVCAAGPTDTPGFVANTPLVSRRALRPMSAEAVAREALDGLGKGPLRVAGRLNRVLHLVTGRLLSRRDAVRFFSSNTRRLYSDDNRDR